MDFSNLKPWILVSVWVTYFAVIVTWTFQSGQRAQRQKRQRWLAVELGGVVLGGATLAAFGFPVSVVVFGVIVVGMLILVIPPRFRFCEGCNFRQERRGGNPAGACPRCGGTLR